MVRDQRFRIELTVKGEEALSKVVKIELLRHLPIILEGEKLSIVCGLCLQPLEAETSEEAGNVAICSECGHVYHQSCIKVLRDSSSTTRCANQACPGRKRNLALLQTIKLVK